MQKTNTTKIYSLKIYSLGLITFWELTPEGKEAAQGIPGINEPMCIPITNIQLEKMEELNGERKDGAD